MEQTIEEHIDELKRYFLWIIVPGVILFFAFFYYSELMIEFLISFLEINKDNLVSITPFESLQTRFTLSGILTLTFLIPMILVSLYKFSKPAIPNRLIKSCKGYVLGSFVLAIVGMTFGVFIFSKMVLTSLLNYQLVSTMWSIKSVMDFIILSGFSLGIVAQIAVVIPLLCNIGIVNKKTLKEYSLYALPIILLVSAIITPPDIISQIFMAIPIYGFFWIGILVSKSQEVKKC